MSALKKILLLFFICIVFFSFLFFIRFSLFNSDLKYDFGYDDSFIKKNTFSSLIKGEGEKITFSAPIEKISEFKLDLVGESIEVLRDNSLKEIKIEVYYPESSFGEVSSKIDYKFYTKGDALVFSTDKSTWKKRKSNQESLLVGLIIVTLPESISSLSISNLFGETIVKGEYPLLSFISFEGPFIFEGSSQRMTLESFRGSLSLEGTSSQEYSFDSLIIRTLYSQIMGKGFANKVNLVSLSSQIIWDGFLKDFSLISAFLDMNVNLMKVEKGAWDISSLIGESKVYLPNNAKKESRYNLFIRQDKINSLLDIEVKSLGMALNYFY